jgi:hypothetical protein
LPPWRFRVRHEPSDRIDAYPTVDLPAAPPTWAVDALFATWPIGPSIVVVDLLAIAAGRRTRARRALKDLLAREGLSASVVADPASVRRFVTLADRPLTVALIDGPVDRADVLALERSIAAGEPPLDAELRAAVVAQIGPRRGLWAQCRGIGDAWRLTERLTARALALAAGVERIPDPVLADVAPVGATFLVRPGSVSVEDGTLTAPIILADRPRRTVVARLHCDLATGQSRIQPVRRRR